MCVKCPEMGCMNLHGKESGVHADGQLQAFRAGSKGVCPRWIGVCQGHRLCVARFRLATGECQVYSWPSPDNPHMLALFWTVFLTRVTDQCFSLSSMGRFSLKQKYKTIRFIAVSVYHGEKTRCLIFAASEHAYRCNQRFYSARLADVSSVCADMPPRCYVLSLPRTPFQRIGGPSRTLAVPQLLTADFKQNTLLLKTIHTFRK